MMTTCTSPGSLGGTDSGALSRRTPTGSHNAMASEVPPCDEPHAVKCIVIQENTTACTPLQLYVITSACTSQDGFAS